MTAGVRAESLHAKHDPSTTVLLSPQEAADYRALLDCAKAVGQVPQ